MSSDTTIITKTDLATDFFQKPHEIDDGSVTPSPIVSQKYEKPNAYDEEPPMVITASRHGSRSSKMTTDSFSSRYFQRKGPSTIVADFSAPPSPQNKTASECYSPNTPIESPPLSPKPPATIKKERYTYNSQLDYQNITSFILSQPTPTTQTSCHHHEDENNTLPSYYVLPSSPANSITGVDTSTINNNAASNNVAAATAALLSNDSGIISSFFLYPSKRETSNAFAKGSSSNTNNNNTVVYCFKKASILKPNQHHIFLHIDHPDEDDEEIMVYRKIQPYSYTWGLQSMLYCNKNDGQGFKVAEARRRAFQKEIFIESADYDNSEIDDITQTHISNIKNIPATTNINCQNLIKRSQSNLLFEYEIWFHGSRMRWKRPSLLSHDFTCEIKLTRQETKLYLLQKHKEQQKKKPSNFNKQKNRKSKNSSMNGYPISTNDGGFIDSDSDNDEDDHDNHSHKTCRRWKLLAEFHSHKLSYLNKELGKLSIDLDILNQVEKERCDLLEANVVMTCSTLIDLIRDVMGKQ